MKTELYRDTSVFSREHKFSLFFFFFVSNRELKAVALQEKSCSYVRYTYSVIWSFKLLESSLMKRSDNQVAATNGGGD